MKAKKAFYALAAILFFAAVSCETSSTSAEDELHELGVDRSKVKTKAS